MTNTSNKKKDECVICQTSDPFWLFVAHVRQNKEFEYEEESELNNTNHVSIPVLFYHTVFNIYFSQYFITTESLPIQFPMYIVGSVWINLLSIHLIIYRFVYLN